MAEKVATMDGTVPEAKYQKLATEYSKLRAQASVLKKAVLEEQAKETNLREQLRQRETSLRRTEQEVDSLGFRNKQLESRVLQLQEELKKKEKEPGRRGLLGSKKETLMEATPAEPHDSIREELEKYKRDNAHLISLIHDKERDLMLYDERITALQQQLEKSNSDQNELEKRLRKDVETLQHRNSELETKLVDAASMLGSEDTLSATGSDSTPLHHTQQQAQVNCNVALTAEERIALLEKEVAHWRTQYEVAKLNQNFDSNSGNKDLGCSCSTAAAGVTVKPSSAESKGNQRARDSLHEPPEPATKEQLIYSIFSKKYEDLLRLKAQSESRQRSFETEVLHLQICLDNATQELKAKDEQLSSLGGNLQMLEEELMTTRINYEEQISMLTEQVISFREQLGLL